MIITKQKEKPKYTLTDEGETVEENRAKINRAEIAGVQVNDTFTQFLIDTPAYTVKDAITGFTDPSRGGLPYILINYNDSRTEQFVFNHQCHQAKLDHAYSPDGKTKQFAVWCYNWPGDLKEVQFTLEEE